MPIRKLRAGRVPTVTANQYVGERGTIFWDENTGNLRLSDGTLAGGKVLNPAVAAVGLTPPPNPYVGELWYDPTSKELWAYYNGAFRGTINPATPTELGGIKAGPGVVVASDGTLSLDSSGIPFNFGDFVATTPPNGSATLSSLNADQDIDIVSNGTGVINAIGNFHIHRTATYNPEVLDPDGAVFIVNSDGRCRIRTSSLPIGDSVLIVSANTSNTFIPLASGAVGAVLQLVGADNSSTTVGIDNFSNTAASSGNFTFRRYRGTPDTPLAVQANDLVAAVGSTAFDGTGTATLPAQVTSIRFVASENQTLTAKGSRIDMYAIPIGTAARTLNLSLDGVKVSVPLDTQSTSTTSGALVTAGGLGVAKNVYVGGTIYGALTGNVTGNVSGTAPAGSLTGTTLNSTVVTSSLTSVGTLGSLAVTNNVQAGTFTGKLIRSVRDGGTIAAGGTLTINFATDDIVYCVWGDGMTLAYSNYTAGSVVRILATKSAGSGNNDPINLDGVTAANVSNGATVTANYTAATTACIELTCTGTTIGSVYVKV